MSGTKAYDGTTTSGEVPAVSGLKGSDSVSDLTQAYQSKHVLGTDGSTLEVTSCTVHDGDSGGNYHVVDAQSRRHDHPGAADRYGDERHHEGLRR